MTLDWIDWIERARFGDVASLTRCVRRHAHALPHPAPPARAAPYGRVVLARTERGEVMLAAWRPGARSAPHDHGGAGGVVVVLAGTITETRFAFDGRELVPARSERYSAWDALTAPPDAIHEMGAPHGGLTLHIYAPRIELMRLFDMARRATVVVSGDRGAWLDEGASSKPGSLAWQA